MKSRASKRPKPASEPYLAPGKYHERAVVSSFIFAPKNMQDDKFALFKRNLKLKTYPGKWAVCSGSIEEYDDTPIMAAKREITEETSLPETEYALMVQGKPFTLTDEKLRTKWTIHPFSWRMAKRPKPIRLDWEHEEYRFVTPRELKRFDHVPQLEIGLNRVLLSEETKEDLSTMRDTTHPSPTAFAHQAFTLLRTSLTSPTGDLHLALSTPELWREVRWKAWHHVFNSHPKISYSSVDTKSNRDEAAIAKLALKEALATMLDIAARNLDCSTTAEVEGLEVGAVRDALRGALEMGGGAWLEKIVEGVCWDGEGGLGEEVWENVMEGL